MKDQICETGIHQNPRGEQRQQHLRPQPQLLLLDMSSKARETKAKMNYWDFIKIKTFCTAKEQSTKSKDNQQKGRRYLQMTYQIKG